MDYKYKTSIIFLITSLTCQAETINLNFEKIELKDFAKVVYADIKNTGYIIDETIANKSISVHANALTESNIDEVVNEALRLSGLQAKKLGNIYSLEPYKPHFELRIYRPKFRNVEYLTDLLKQAFPDQEFGFNGQSSLKNSGNTEGAGQYARHVNDYLIYRASDKINNDINKFLLYADTKNVTLQIIGGSYEFTDTQNKGSAINAIGELLKTKLKIDFTTTLTGVSSSFTLPLLGLNAVLKIIDSDSRFQSISKPSLIIDSGETATFNAGSDVPVLAGTTATNTAVQQNIQYRSSGTLLTVKPVALQDVIHMDVKQEYSNFIQNRTSNIETPILNKRLIETKVTLKDGDVLVLAGLTENRSSNNKSGLGFATLSKSSDSTKAETVLLLQVIANKEKEPEIKPLDNSLPKTENEQLSQLIP